ncbi:MAG: toxin-antitoxin system protein [Firmicutes bacterium]|nr:toxin-antitoxin system protein [Bacillota bacterium]
MKDTTTIRVSRDVYNAIKYLAKQTNENMQDIVENAVNEYKKRRFFEEMNNAYAKLKSDPKAWDEEKKERELWDITLSDGLETEYEGK